MLLTKVDVRAELLPGEKPGGEIRIGDVRELMPGLLSDYSGRVQLIYMDPPFNSGQAFSMRIKAGEREWRSGTGTLMQPAYEDKYRLDEYTEMMRGALTGARELLCESGVIYLHVDYRMHARMRLMMDEVFGEHNFLNDIVWAYQTGGRAKNFYSRKHDNILFYRKGRKYFFDITKVPIERADVRRNHMKRHVDADGRVYRSIKSGGKIYTYYDDEPAYPGDVWDDVSHLQQKDPQRTGYDTQKPLRLLDRIVLSSSRPGDIVLDPFAGSGTTLESAQVSGRKFVGCDMSPHSLEVMRRRLGSANMTITAPPSPGEPLVEAKIETVIAFYYVKLNHFELESGVCARAFSGLDALDNWSAGYLRGEVFHSLATDIRTRRKPALSDTLEIPVLGGTPCIRVSDVMGRHFFYTIQPPAV